MQAYKFVSRLPNPKIACHVISSAKHLGTWLNVDLHIPIGTLPILFYQVFFEALPDKYE